MRCRDENNNLRELCVDSAFSAFPKPFAFFTPKTLGELRVIFAFSAFFNFLMFFPISNLLSG
jgi:hypothetical protein